MTCILIIVFMVPGFQNELFLSLCYLAMLKECCQKIKYTLVINLHFRAACRQPCLCRRKTESYFNSGKTPVITVHNSYRFEDDNVDGHQ